MKSENKNMIRLKFEPRDLWVGVYLQPPVIVRTGEYKNKIFICLVPMLPVIITWTKYVLTDEEISGYPQEMRREIADRLQLKTEAIWLVTAQVELLNFQFRARTFVGTEMYGWISPCFSLLDLQPKVVPSMIDSVVDQISGHYTIAKEHLENDVN
ncbi:hypothetical protein LCGC14_2633970 [marine sediment metagenome]|uniref:Uncharacterized protein n=1 Tax=marine sediment metagenome TaxID=412755 RepID=A0A0F8ZZA3_9ZZZZ